MVGRHGDYSGILGIVFVRGWGLMGEGELYVGTYTEASWGKSRTLKARL